MIRVIDIETTGTDPAADAIIEIASVDLLRGGGITNPMDTLVRPGNPFPRAPRLIAPLLPLLACICVVLLLVTYVPEIYVWLPRNFGLVE